VIAVLNIFICEDNNNQREQITNITKNYIEFEDLDIKIAMSSNAPEPIIQYLSEHEKTAGLYFLDVDLNNDMNGVKLAENIRKYDPRGFIVFVTAHEEALPLTFKYKVEALDFIPKSDFQVGSRICECIRDAYTKYTGKTNELNDNYVFKVNHSIMSVAKDDILFFEASIETPHKIILHAKNGIYNFYSNMKDIEKSIGENFFRSHKSFIINLKKVKSIDKTSNTIYMVNKSTCLVSVRQMPKLLELMKLSP